MNRYRLSVEANVDFREVYAYIARSNLTAAERLRQRFFEKFELLGRFPLLGEVRRDLPAVAREIRSFSLGEFVIYYRVLSDQSDQVEIIRLARGAQDVDTLSANNL